ncbi:hypothetical protein AB6806_10885 [Bosea sp. RCC_152_1]|uniref:hypothetical protein n=1 Tax=Bosea sp. RCC_152_1 TaxID=3239228 RepID=UPI0035257CDF
MQKQAENEAIGLERLATLLMLSKERVRQLVRDGHIPKSQRNTYPIIKAVQDYIAFLKDEERRTSKAQAESGLKNSRQTEIDMRIAERRRELIELKEAELALARIVGVVNAEIAGLPVRVTRDVPQRREIEKRLNESFERIDKALARGRRALETGQSGCHSRGRRGLTPIFGVPKTENTRLTPAGLASATRIGPQGYFNAMFAAITCRQRRNCTGPGYSANSPRVYGESGSCAPRTLRRRRGS